jgi:peptidoglycan/LPS O-acetylase OafA/YrhL
LTPGPDQRDNNFDFLRQFAAFCVIVGHSQSLVSTFGVQIFFAVSGFLVTESWLRGPKIGSFLKKRTSRIFPGLMVCILLTALVMGPLLTRLPVGEYFDHPGTLLYLKNIFLSPVYFLPGLFEGNTYPNAVNGSLWSLPVEFA